MCKIPHLPKLQSFEQARILNWRFEIIIISVNYIVMCMSYFSSLYNIPNRAQNICWYDILTLSINKWTLFKFVSKRHETWQACGQHALRQSVSYNHKQDLRHVFQQQHEIHWKMSVRSATNPAFQPCYQYWILDNYIRFPFISRYLKRRISWINEKELDTIFMLSS